MPLITKSAAKGNTFANQDPGPDGRQSKFAKKVFVDVEQATFAGLEAGSSTTNTWNKGANE